MSIIVIAGSSLKYLCYLRSGKPKQGFSVEILPMMASPVTHCFLVLGMSRFFCTLLELGIAHATISLFSQEVMDSWILHQKERRCLG